MDASRRESIAHAVLVQTLVRGSGFELERELVLVAPEPVLARLERADDRVPGRVVVRSRVLVGRVVAAADLAAGHAFAEVHPPAARAQTLRAAFGARGSDVEVDRVEVRAFQAHGSPIA